MDFALAFANSPEVARAKASYQTALTVARVARQAPSPTLTLTAEYSKEAGGSSPWLYGVGTDFPLDLGARRDARLGTADLTALQALYGHYEQTFRLIEDYTRPLSEEARVGLFGENAARFYRVR